MSSKTGRSKSGEQPEGNGPVEAPGIEAVAASGTQGKRRPSTKDNKKGGPGKPKVPAQTDGRDQGDTAAPNDEPGVVSDLDKPDPNLPSTLPAKRSPGSLVAILDYFNEPLRPGQNVDDQIKLIIARTVAIWGVILAVLASLVAMFAVFVVVGHYLLPDVSIKRMLGLSLLGPVGFLGAIGAVWGLLRRKGGKGSV